MCDNSGCKQCTCYLEKTTETKASKIAALVWKMLGLDPEETCWDHWDREKFEKKVQDILDE